MAARAAHFGITLIRAGAFRRSSRAVGYCASPDLVSILVAYRQPPTKGAGCRSGCSEAQAVVRSLPPGLHAYCGWCAACSAGVVAAGQRPGVVATVFVYMARVTETSRLAVCPSPCSRCRGPKAFEFAQPFLLVRQPAGLDSGCDAAPSSIGAEGRLCRTAVRARRHRHAGRLTGTSPRRPSGISRLGPEGAISAPARHRGAAPIVGGPDSW